DPASRQQTAAELRNELEAVLEIIEGEGAIGRAVARVIEPRQSRPSISPPSPPGSTPVFSKNAGTLDGVPLPAGGVSGSTSAVAAAASGALASFPRWVLPAGVGAGVVVLAGILGATLFGGRMP